MFTDPETTAVTLRFTDPTSNCKHPKCDKPYGECMCNTPGYNTCDCSLCVIMATPPLVPHPMASKSATPPPSSPLKRKVEIPVIDLTAEETGLVTPPVKLPRLEATPAEIQFEKKTKKSKKPKDCLCFDSDYDSEGDLIAPLAADLSQLVRAWARTEHAIRRPSDWYGPETDPSVIASQLETFGSDLANVVDIEKKKAKKPQPYCPAYTPEYPVDVKGFTEFTLQDSLSDKWCKLVSETTYPSAAVYSRKQFSYDPSYCGSKPAHPSTDTAFICDRLYYKSREGHSFPLLVYQLEVKQATSRGMQAEDQNYNVVCPKDCDDFRLYMDAMRRARSRDATWFHNFFYRETVCWEEFRRVADVLRNGGVYRTDEFWDDCELESAYDELDPVLTSADPYCDWLAHRLFCISFDDLASRSKVRDVRLVVPGRVNHSFPGYWKTYSHTIGGEDKFNTGVLTAEELEAVTDRLEFNYLNIDYNYFIECRTTVKL